MRRPKTLRIVVLTDPGATLTLGESASPDGPVTPILIPPDSLEAAYRRAKEAAAQVAAGALTPEMSAWVQDALAALGRGESAEHALGVGRRPGRPVASSAYRDAVLALSAIAADPPLRDSAERVGAFARVAETLGTDEATVERAYQAWVTGALRLIDLRGANPR